MTQGRFNALWPHTENPSCDTGMVLLKRWVERDPRTVEYLPNIAWADPPSALRWSQEWQEFHAHRCLCPKCNKMP